MKRVRGIAIALLAIHLAPSNAADLKAPFEISTAKVLPKGVRNIRYKGLNADANNKFTNNGREVTLADPFFKEVTWRDLTDPKTDTFKKGTLEGYLVDKGINLDQSVGRTTGDVSVGANAHVPVFAYGFTKSLTVAIAVPIVQYEISVDTGFESNGNLQAVYNHLENDQKKPEQRELVQKMLNPVHTKAEEFGYKRIQNQKGTLLGDIKTVLKYQFLERETFALTLQNDYTLPTGKEADVNKIVDVPGGDGQMDIGLGLIGDLYPMTDLGLTASFGYTHQLADTTAKRIPYRTDSTLSPDVDSKTKRQLGGIFNSQVGAKYEVVSGFNLNSSYNFLYKDKDRYSGNQYASTRYNLLEDKTYQNMQSVQLGLGYSTLPLFQQKKFPVPLEANISHARVLKGKNVTKDPLTSLEFVMYF